MLQRRSTVTAGHVGANRRVFPFKTDQSGVIKELREVCDVRVCPSPGNKLVAKIRLLVPYFYRRARVRAGGRVHVMSAVGDVHCSR